MYFWSIVLLALLHCRPANALESFQQLLRQPLHIAGEVATSLVLEDGQIVVAGNFEKVNGVAQPRLARLNPDGTLDSTWRPLVQFPVRRVFAADGFIYFFGSDPMKVGRVSLSGEGTVDSPWLLDPAIVPLSSESTEDVVLRDGYIYVLSRSYNFFISRGFSGHLLLRRFRATDGAFDSQWGEKTVRRFGGFLSDCRLQVDAEFVYVTHALFSFSSPSPIRLGRYTVAGNGALDRSWYKVIRTTRYGGLRDLGQDDHYLYLAGYGQRVPGKSPQFGAGLARIAKAQAVVDPKWPETSQPSNFSYALAVSVTADAAYVLTSSGIAMVSTSDQKAPISLIEIGNGHYDRVSVGAQAIYISVARNDTGEARVIRGFDRETFFPQQDFVPALVNPGVVNKVEVRPDGTTYVAGLFTQVGSHAVNGLVRFLPDGSLDSSWIPLGLDFVTLVKDFKVTATGVFAWTEYDLKKFSVNAPGRADDTWAPETHLPRGSIDAVQFTDQAVYFSFTLQTQDRRTILGRASLNGKGVPVHLAGMNVHDGADLFVSDRFLYVKPSSSTKLARFHLEGSNVRDLKWHPPEQERYGRPRFASDGTYLYVANGSAVARYPESGNGDPDLAWNPAFFDPQFGSPEINSLECAGGSVYLSGVWETVAFVRRISPTGAVDWDFGPEIPLIRRFSGSYEDYELSGCRWIGELDASPVLGGIVGKIDGEDAFAPLKLSSDFAGQ